MRYFKKTELVRVKKLTKKEQKEAIEREDMLRRSQNGKFGSIH